MPFWFGAPNGALSRRIAQYRRRKKGESIQSLYNEIRRLLALSFPGEKSEICEILGRGAFLTALGDPVLRVRVLDQNPKNLEFLIRP